LPTSAGVLCKSFVSSVAQLYIFFRIELGDGHLKQFLDQSKALNPEERGELLEKAEGIINTHKELALEGQTKVRKLQVIEFSLNIS
jgi:Ubiquitin carboxyl-terminal hydrolase, family 1.